MSNDVVIDRGYAIVPEARMTDIAADFVGASPVPFRATFDRHKWPAARLT